MGSLEGKTAVITGGNSGIGLSIAQLFVDEGASVVVSGRNETTLASAGQQLGGASTTVKADVRNLADLDAVVAAANGKIDVLVVNAGGAQVRPIEMVDEDTFDLQQETNFKGAFFTIQKALPYLGEGSSVIITSSVANVKGMPGMSVYGASKAAVRSLTRTLAAELAPKGIRVNTISPGPIETPIFNRVGIPEEHLDEARKGFESMVPLGRFGQPEDIAEAALFLANANYVTGIDLPVDGGLAQV